MNYRTWLLYRSKQVVREDSEPAVLGYQAWQNRQSLQAWYRRAEGAFLRKHAASNDHDQRWLASHLHSSL